MNAARRWWSVALGVLLLITIPVAVRGLPVPDDKVSATTLLHRIQASRSQPFSGYVETAGTVALPDNDALSGLSTLLGASSKVRVWWRDPRTWRVATLRTTGETDLVHTGNHVVRWVYESKRATLSPDVPVRLPDTTDVLPNELARHVLQGARASELSRITGKRLAGRVALGLRLRPSDRQAGISRVDVYADRATGLPLEVRLFARGSSLAALTSRFADIDPGTPPSSALRFSPPHDARLRYDDIVDLASAANRFAARVPPRTLGGLPARGVGRDELRGSVGVYGRGPTVLIAVPLWSRSGDRVKKDLSGQPGVLQVAQGTLLGAPPLHLLLGNAEPNGTRWLLAGTVTRRALTEAADELVRDRPALRGQTRRTAPGFGS